MPLPLVQKLLQVAAAVVIGFGALIALAAHPSTAAPIGLLADIIVWPFDGRPVLDQQGARLLSAISGGVMVGWGVLLYQLSTHLLPADPALAAKLIRSSMLAWFAVDSTFSVIAGAPLNVAANAAFLVAFLWPLSRLSGTQATVR